MERRFDHLPRAERDPRASQSERGSAAPRRRRTLGESEVPATGPPEGSVSFLCSQPSGGRESANQTLLISPRSFSLSPVHLKGQPSSFKRLISLIH